MSKKTAKMNKDLRRKKEILKAQSKSSFRDYAAKVVENTDVNATQPKKATHTLDLKMIKTDLLKTGIYAILVVGFLIFLKTQNLEFDLTINK